MIIDFLIIILVILLIYIGYKRGFFVQVINLLFSIFYLLFANSILDNILAFLNNDFLLKQLAPNTLTRFFVLFVMGLILMTIINIVLKNIFKIKLLSFINRSLGILVSLIISYLLICISNVVFTNLSNYIELSESIKKSFFLSQSFSNYNILMWWWLNVK